MHNKLRITGMKVKIKCTYPIQRMVYLHMLLIQQGMMCLTGNEQ